MRNTILLTLVMIISAAALAGCQNGGVSYDPKDIQYVYTVQPGDVSFGQVAENAYGDWSMWEHVEKANPSVGPADLKPGMKLNIPTVPDASAKMVQKKA